jgi:hypothetical protein
MQLETKFLRLCTPVELGSHFGDWHLVLVGRLEQVPAVLLGDGGETGAAPRNDWPLNAWGEMRPREATHSDFKKLTATRSTPHYNPPNWGKDSPYLLIYARSVDDSSKAGVISP